MSRRIDIDDATGEVVVTFRFDRAVKDAVKAIPGARFHGASKSWRFQASRVEHVVAVLAPQGFTWHGPPLEPAQAADASSQQPVEQTPTYRVRDVNQTIATTLRKRFPRAFWVAGQVANYDKNRAGGHAWFDLIDVATDAPNAAPLPNAPSLRAVVFRDARAQMLAALRRHRLSFADGMVARLRVRVEFYVPKGTVQLVVEEIDVAWSAGTLALKRDEVIQAVRAAGFAETQRALPMPSVPLRVALVTSVESDAYHDVLSGLRACGAGFAVTPFDVRVQGPDLSKTVCAALRLIARRAARFDVVVITRGGGSRVELGGWDDIPVALAVAQLPVKTVVAIGHQQDRCALDALSASAKTPTQAAEVLVQRVEAARDRTTLLAERIIETTSTKLAGCRRGLRDNAARLSQRTQQNITRQRGTIDATLPRMIASAAERRLAQNARRLDRFQREISGEKLRRLTGQRSQQLDRLTRQLTRAATERTRRERQAIHYAATTLRMVHPDNLLRRGFAILRDANRAPLVSSKALAPGTELFIQMADGEINATVAHVAPASPSESDE